MFQKIISELVRNSISVIFAKNSTCTKISSHTFFKARSMFKIFIANNMGSE
jgi:hypothetical protein